MKQKKRLNVDEAHDEEGKKKGDILKIIKDLLIFC